MEILCPRFGKCKASKRCPIEKLISEVTLTIVYVRGECAGSKAGLVSIQPRKPIARINEEVGA